MAHESGIPGSAGGAGRAGWLGAIRLYLAAILAANFGWEIAQLPLYTIWWEAAASDIVFALIHCTLGDVVIGAACLVLALVLFGTRRWPSDECSFARVAVTAVGLSIVYTIYSEWLNVRVLATWQYTTAMPVLPPLGIGLAPLLQWIVIPPASFWLTWRKVCLAR